MSWLEELVIPENAEVGDFAFHNLNQDMVISYLSINSLQKFYSFDSLTHFYSSRNIISVHPGSYFSIALSKSGLVSSWGFNSYGNLGIGSYEVFNTPQVVDFNGLDINEKVIQVSVGNSYVLALTNKGKLFAWGENSQGQLGLGHQSNIVLPTRIFFPSLSSGEIITKILATASSSYALTSLGNIYAWGDNEYGQIGDGSYANASVPKKITISILESNEKPILLEGYGARVWIVTSSNRLFGWGSNFSFSLGKMTHQYQFNSPSLITISGLALNEYIVSIKGGHSHSLALTNFNRIIAWGSNYSYQLGIDGEGLFGFTILSNSIFNLETDEAILLIEAGGFSSFLLTSKAKVFGWGDNRTENNFLGLNQSELSKTFIPQHIFIENLLYGENIVDIQVTFAYHAFAISNIGRVYSWGSNYKQSVINNGREVNQFPRPVLFG
jgi:alpha-tubulin suppressor-like RCC1 family protein